MGLRRTTIFGMTLDDLFAYEAPKLVKVRDYKVGCLYYVLMLLVFVYIIIFQVIYNLGYIEFRQPSQTVRLNLKEPTMNECDPLTDPGCHDNYPASAGLGYCCHADCTSVAGGSSSGACKCDGANNSLNYDCEYLDGIRASTITGNSILVQTRFSEYEQTRSDSKECNSTACDNRWDHVGIGKTNFVAGVENFSLQIDHTVAQQEFGLFKTNEQMHGFLLIKGTGPLQQELCRERVDAVTNPDSRIRTDTAPCYIEPRSAPGTHKDTFYVSTLLKAMGLSLDDAGAANNTLTRRSEGFTVMVKVEYFNTRKLWGLLPRGAVSYIIRLKPVAGDHYQATNVVWKQFPTSRYQVVSNGILFSVVPDGQVGHFNPQQLLVTLTTSLGMLAICGILVKHLTTKLAERKEFYRSYLIEESVDFGIMDALEQKSGAELQELLKARDLPQKGSKKDRIIRLLQDGWAPGTSGSSEGRPYGTFGDCAAASALAELAEPLPAAAARV